MRKQMKFPSGVKVYGDQSFRGRCPMEALEQVTFFARLRRQYPDTWGLLAHHARNEGRRTHLTAAKEKSEGMTAGMPDIIILGGPAFVCELKRRDHTQSKIAKEQEACLLAAQVAGAWVCIALGVDAAWEAFSDYLAAR
jgi:hypothetical protein